MTRSDRALTGGARPRGPATVLLVLLVGFPAAAPAQSLPSGFVDEVIVGGLNQPTAFTRLPDGTLLIAEKAGLVRVFKNGTPLSTPFIDLRSSVNDYWDHGLIGIAADANFASNGYVYLLYTYENDPLDYSGPKTARLTRVTASGDVAAPNSAVTILGTLVGSSCSNFPAGSDCIPSDEPSHSVGNIKVAADGTLFVTSGDGASFNVVDDNALRAQNVDTLAGKLLHITPTGKGVPENPFWNGDENANRSKVWAYGMRNPYRFTIHPASGQVYLGDVGWGEWEEINAPLPGANLGWPCYEGFLHQSGYEAKPYCQSLYAAGSGAVQMPTVAYYHNTGGSYAVTAGVFYNGTSFPEQYRGAFFYGDYANTFVRYFQVNAAGAKSGPITGFGADLAGPVYFDTDGENLLYVAINTGEIHRIRYTTPNSGVSYLSDRPWSSMSNGLGPVERDQSNGGGAAYDGSVITLAGQHYPKGLGVQAPSDVRFAMSGACSAFAASIGIDDEVGSNGTVDFQVWTDGVKVYDSAVMAGDTATKAINLDVSGKNELRLVVTDGGDGNASDHGDWANARLTCTAGPDVTPPVVTSVSPGNLATGVAVGTNVTATFSEPMNAATLTTSTVTLVPQGSTTPVAATVTYASGTNTVTLDPTANLAANTTYTARIKGGSGGAQDAAGNPLAVDKVWSFTTVVPDTTPPIVTVVSPPTGSTGVTVTVNATGIFSEPMNAATLTTATVTLVAQGSSTPLPAAVSYDAATRTVTLDPTATLAASTLHTVTIKGGSNGAKDVAGNPLAADKVWTFTTAAAGASAYLSDRPWSTMTNGWGPVERDHSNGENGAGDGGTITLNGVTYAKGLGAHARSDVRYALNGACSAFTAVVGVDDEVATRGSVAFQVSTDGTTRYDSGVMTGSSASRSIYVDVSGATELALIVTDGGVDGIDADHADWADAQVSCGTGTTAPTVTATAPTSGATGVTSSANVTATFSKPMDAATLTTATVTLVAQGSSTPLAAAVSYDAATSTVTLDPTATLAASTLYTVTIKGGSNGAKDVTGTALAADKVWTFTTAAAGASAYLSDRPWSTMTNGWGPVERDHSNGENNAGDGGTITLNGVTYAKGLGAHALSDVRYALNGGCSTFTAVVGVDDEVAERGSVAFQVRTDGTTRYDSGVMTGSSASRSIYVDVRGATELALIVTDGGVNGIDSDHADWADAQVSCSAANGSPTATISQPVSTLTYKVGDVITYSGSGSDPEDGTLPPASLSWNIVIFHCPGGACHTHAFISSTGASGSFTVPDHGDDSYFQINLTATDSAGLRGTTSVTIQPQTVQFTLNTSPTGLQVVYGGTTFTAPSVHATIVGSTHTIYAPSPQNGLAFVSWSDGGAQQHNVTVGTTNVTYVATFSGATASDTTPPTVTSVTPADGSTHVATMVRPTVTFSEPMNAPSFTAANATVTAQGTSAAVAASVTYDVTARTVTIRPANRLANRTVYTVRVAGGSGGVTDLAGNPLASDKIWTFTTR